MPSYRKQRHTNTLLLRVQTTVKKMRAMIPDAECEVHKNDTLRNRSTDLESLVDAVSAHASKKKKKSVEP